MIRSRLYLLLAVLLCALPLAAEQKPLTTGYVTAINPFTRVFSVHGGLLAIDASHAEFRGPTPNDVAYFEMIHPGSQIAAVFEPGPYNPGRGIPASIIQILQQPEGTMTGEIEAIDLTARTLTLVGHEIVVTPDTRYTGSLYAVDPHSLEDLHVGQPITVFLGGKPQALEAFSIFAIAPTQGEHLAFSGILKQIKGDTWYLTRSAITEFKVISTTSIEGNPHIGDLISVFGRKDDGVISATSIQVRQQPCPNFQPNPRFGLTGFIVSRTDTQIVINTGQGIYTTELTDETLWDGEPVAGENATVDVEKIGDRYVALKVTRHDYAVHFFIADKVTEITATRWKIGGFDVTVTDATTIHGEPKLGDEVLVIADRNPSGEIVAKDITKRP
jgi:hypothetical protein